MFSVALRRKGFDLIYDPLVLVDHYEGDRAEPRHYSLMLSIQDARAFSDVAFNWALVISEEQSSVRQFIFLIWSFFVGTRITPGLIQAVRFTWALGRLSWQRFWLTQQGTFQAYFWLLQAARKRRFGATNCGSSLRASSRDREREA